MPSPKWRPEVPGVRKTRIYPLIPTDEIDNYRALAHAASKVRGFTALDSQDRVKQQQFNKLVRVYYKRGVRIVDLARAAGVTDRTIRHRLVDRV